MHSQGLCNKTGLTFSFSDVNFDTSNLNFVPVALETEAPKPDIKIKKEEIVLPVIEKIKTSEDNFQSFIPQNFKQIPETTPFCNFDEPAVHSEAIVNLTANQNDVKQEIFSTHNYSVVNSNQQYEPISYYWFYCTIVNGLAEWKPFSLIDSNRIELKFCQYFKNRDTYDLVDDCVPTDGGRYDVFIRKRQKLSVYWEEAPMEIRRASWFYRPEDESFYLPYTESECELLEEKYRYVLENDLWHQPFELGGDSRFDDRFIFHSSNTMVEYRRGGAFTDGITKGRIVYRGIDGFRAHLQRGETDIIDHVVFVVHGIGSVCDMYGRGIVDSVGAMRHVSAGLIRSHFAGHTGRVELIPVSWHSKFHSSDHHAFDRNLAPLTLRSVPKLRNFTNETLVDVLCYSSPAYCQSILAIVAAEMNRLRHLFVSRNPLYDGSISIAGHSLGSMIVFDLACLLQRGMVPGVASNDVPPLEFDVGHVFALGSPISLLLTARGQVRLGDQFTMSPIVKGHLFNIFHPLDPVAYRIEPMLASPDTRRIPPRRPVVVPHHKGRKRLHLELKDNLVRVGHDIKSRLFQTLKSTWSSLQEFATAHRNNLADELSAQDVDSDELMRVLDKIDISSGEQDDAGSSCTDDETDGYWLLNGGGRVDYVLQEAPLESFNEYLFALSSHGCYWESEDTVLMMLKQIYHTLNIVPVARPQPPSEMPSPIIQSKSAPNLSILKSLAPQPRPPLMPNVPSSTVTNTMLPKTFPNVQSTSFFQPNFQSENSPDETHNPSHPEQPGLNIQPRHITQPSASNLVSPLSIEAPPLWVGTSMGSMDRTNEHASNHMAPANTVAGGHHSWAHQMTQRLYHHQSPHNSLVTQLQSSSNADRFSLPPQMTPALHNTFQPSSDCVETTVMDNIQSMVPTLDTNYIPMDQNRDTTAHGLTVTPLMAGLSHNNSSNNLASSTMMYVPSLTDNNCPPPLLPCNISSTPATNTLPQSFDMTGKPNEDTPTMATISVQFDMVQPTEPFVNASFDMLSYQSNDNFSQSNVPIETTSSSAQPMNTVASSFDTSWQPNYYTSQSNIFMPTEPVQAPSEMLGSFQSSVNNSKPWQPINQAIRDQSDTPVACTMSNRKSSLLDMFNDLSTGDHDDDPFQSTGSTMHVTSSSQQHRASIDVVTTCDSSRQSSVSPRPQSSISQGYHSQSNRYEDSGRTPSPRMPPVMRNSPRSNRPAKTHQSATMLNTRPLVPQSGKLFKKK